MADATPPEQMQSWTSQQELHYIHGQVLNNGNSAKYLGLNIHKTLSLDVHINEVTEKRTTPCPSQAQTSVVRQQTSKTNATPHLWDHLLNAHLQTHQEPR
jgi:hypothetical protein